MDANSKSITFALATTLLLAIAANANPDSESTEPDYKFSFTDKRTTSVWCAKPTCGKVEDALFDGNRYSPEPAEMLKELTDQWHQWNKCDVVNGGENWPENIYRCFSVQNLILWARPQPRIACKQNSVETFLKFFTMCGNEDKYERYAKYVKHYAIGQFGPCAHKIIEDWNENIHRGLQEYLEIANEFFRAALGINSYLDERTMYFLVAKVDLTKTKLNVSAMVEIAKKYPPLNELQPPKGALQHLFQRLELDFINFGNLAKEDANVVNVARGIGAIEEKELTYRFRLINEYVRCAAQIAHKTTYDSIKRHLKKIYKISKQSRLKNWLKSTWSLPDKLKINSAGNL